MIQSLQSDGSGVELSFTQVSASMVQHIVSKSLNPVVRELDGYLKALFPPQEARSRASGAVSG